MKYINEISLSKVMLNMALMSTLIITSCKKEDIIPNIEQERSVVGYKVDDTIVIENKSKLYKIVDVVDKLSSKKNVSVKPQPKKVRKINKFMYFVKSKFKKS